MTPMAYHKASKPVSDALTPGVFQRWLRDDNRHVHLVFTCTAIIISTIVTCVQQHEQ